MIKKIEDIDQIIIQNTETISIHEDHLWLRRSREIGEIGEIGEIPTIFHGFVSLLSFWHRTRRMDEDTLVKQALNAMTNDNNVKSEWLASFST